MKTPRSTTRLRLPKGRSSAFLAVLLIGAVLVPAAGAAPWDEERGGEDRHDRWEHLEDLAEEIEDSADRVLDEAEESERDRHDRWRLQVVEDLEDLADELEDQVDDDRPSRAALDAFQELTLLHRDAEDLYHRSRNHRLGEELYRMGRLLEQFDLALGGRSGVHQDRRRRGYDEDWRHRRRGPSRTVVPPRIRLDIPF